MYYLVIIKEVSMFRTCQQYVCFWMCIKESDRSMVGVLSHFIAYFVIDECQAYIHALYW